MSRVGHRVVTQEDVDDWISRDPQTATRGATPEMRGEIAEKLQQNLKLLAAAEKQGFDQEKAYLRQRERAADELLARLWMEKIRQTVMITDQEKRAYYKRETNRFRAPIYGLSVIRTKDLAGMQKAQAMLKMGKPFGAIAKFLSVDPASKKRGGALPPIRSRSASPRDANGSGHSQGGESRRPDSLRQRVRTLSLRYPATRPARPLRKRPNSHRAIPSSAEGPA